MPREEKIELFKFDELDEEIKKKLIEKRQNDSYESVYLDCFEDNCREQIREAGWDGEIKVYYDLSHCQGSGLCFIADHLSNERKIKAIYQLRGYSKIQLHEIIQNIDDISIRIKQTDHHYSHERSCKIECSVYDGMEIVDAEDFENELTEILEDERIELCQKLKKEGYEEIENQTSEENAIEYLKECDFLKDGTVWRF